MRSTLLLLPLLLLPLGLGTCTTQATSSPAEVVAAEDRFGRIDLVADGDFPTAVEIDGRRVCGRGVKPCPTRILGGGTNVLSVDVSRGTHEFVLYELRQASGSNFEEARSNVFSVIVDEPAVLRCQLESGSCDAVSSKQASQAAATPTTAAQCRLNSDCPVAEDCRFGMCGPACREDRDCGRGARCGTDAEGHPACVEPSEMPGEVPGV